MSPTIIPYFATGLMYEAGFERIAAIAGGLSAWKQAGGAVEGRNS